MTFGKAKEQGAKGAGHGQAVGRPRAAIGVDKEARPGIATVHAVIDSRIHGYDVVGQAVGITDSSPLQLYRQ
jgi:hypothetical protein